MYLINKEILKKIHNCFGDRMKYYYLFLLYKFVVADWVTEILFFFTTLLKYFKFLEINWNIYLVLFLSEYLLLILKSLYGRGKRVIRTWDALFYKFINNSNKNKNKPIPFSLFPLLFHSMTQSYHQVYCLFVSFFPLFTTHSLPTFFL